VTALLLGFVSLYLMQTTWHRAAGAIVGWVGVIGALPSEVSASTSGVSLVTTVGTPFSTRPKSLV